MQTKAYLDDYYSTHDRGRGSGFKQYQRWIENVEPYVYPGGEMYNYQARLFSTYSKYQQRPNALPQRTTHGYWTDQGPFSYTMGWGWSGGNGMVHCVTVDPADPSTIFVGAPSGGLWKSANGGTSWIPLTDGLPTLGVAGIVIDHTDSDVMYILTGDGDGKDTPSIGVLKSVDGGQTWNPTGLSWVLSWDYPNLIRGYKIKMHPTNPNILFVAASNGLWRTVNGGATWSEVLNGSVTDIEFVPNNPQIMYAVSFGFWRSEDGGNSWDEDGDPDFPGGYSRVEMGVTPDAPAHVYLLFGGPASGVASQFSGVYHSSDYGNDFDLMSNTPNILGWSHDGSDAGNQASYDLAIAVDPTDVDHLFVGGINIWESTNGGASWDLSTHWNKSVTSVPYVHGDFHALEYFNGKLYCTNDGGIYVTLDSGQSWTDLSSGLSIMQFQDIDVVNGLYCGGTQDNGTNQWAVGQTQANHAVGADGFAVIIDYNNTNNRYYSDQNNKFKSTNGGASFTGAGVPGLSGYGSSAWIMHPTIPSTTYLAHLDIYRNTQGANTTQWVDLNAGFTDNTNIRPMVQGVSDPDYLYASTGVSIRYSSNVNAAIPSWADISAGLPFAQAMLRDITVDPSNAQRVWVCFAGFADGQKVFYTSNAGVSWTNVSDNLPNVPVNAIAYQPGSNDALYIGTDIGVFYRNNIIGDWIYYSNGLPTVRVFDIDFDGTYVYAGTHGRGIWRSDLYSTCLYDLTLTPANDPSGSIHTGTQIYHADHEINSTRIITGGLGTNVEYHAANGVILGDGFHVRKNNIFLAKLGGCPD